MCRKYRPLPLLATSLLAFWALMPVEAYASCKQPVYIVAHRCNDPSDVPDVIAAHGNNAIEADFSWAFNRWYVEHDFVNVGSTELADWLAAVAPVVNTPGTPLSLILLDIKDPDGNLELLYSQIRGSFGSNINLIFSIDNWSKRGELVNILDEINADERAGVAIDYLNEADPEQIQANVQAFFKEKGFKRYWFADGYNITAVTPNSVITNVVAGMALRDSEPSCGDFHGVYTWTYEDNETIIDFLNSGVNGIFMNATECHIIGGFPDWEIKDAVDWAKQNLTTSRKFATPSDSPFTLSPEINCPANTTVECTSPGGTLRTDQQLAGFFGAANCSSGYCDPVTLSDNAPSSFPVGTTTDVTFTAVGDQNCTSNCSAKVTVQDTASPLITCPQDIAQDLVSPQGNLVAFNVTASDTCDVNAKVECNPPPGSLFAPGPPTTVTCTAKDASSNQTACSFKVKIFTPQEVIANLEAAVAGLASLNQGQKNSLHSLLTALLDSINASNNASICGQLDGFVAKVSQWIGAGTLTSAEGQPLLTSANNLKKTYGCL